jgi:hypothetical protein
MLFQRSFFCLRLAKFAEKELIARIPKGAFQEIALQKIMGALVQGAEGEVEHPAVQVCKIF